MIPLTQRRSTLEAVARLASSPDGVELLKWLEECREDQRDQNEDANGNEVYRGLGKSKNLTELVTELRDAKDTLLKVKTSEAEEATRLAQQGSVAPLTG